MDYRFFEEVRLSRQARVPWGYRRSVRWLPRIGDIVPDFRADSTQGPLAFHDWAEGGWTVLFGHPLAFTAVCTTEMAALAALAPDFARRGARLVGLSCSPVEEARAWAAEIARLYGVGVSFPLVADPQARLCDLFGMVHEKQSPHCAIRKTMVVGPDLRLRALIEYPMRVGRSSEETLRLLDALQAAEAYNLGVPADWREGDDLVLLPPEMGPPAVPPDRGWRRFSDWFTSVAHPAPAAAPAARRSA